VTYRSNDVARTTVGGVVLVDAFRDTASSGWTVNADRFRLAAPPGHAVTAGPAATEDGVLTAERVRHSPPRSSRSRPTTAPSRLSRHRSRSPSRRDHGFSRTRRSYSPCQSSRSPDSCGESTRSQPGWGPQDATSVGTAVALGSAALLVGLVLSGQATTYFMLHGATPLFAALTGLVVGGLAVTDRVHDWRAFAAAAVGTPLLLGVVGAVVGANAHPRGRAPDRWSCARRWPARRAALDVRRRGSTRRGSQ